MGRVGFLAMPIGRAGNGPFRALSVSCLKVISSWRNEKSPSCLPTYMAGLWCFSPFSVESPVSSSQGVGVLETSGGIIFPTGSSPIASPEAGGSKACVTDIWQPTRLVLVVSEIIISTICCTCCKVGLCVLSSMRWGCLQGGILASHCMTSEANNGIICDG